MNDKSTLINQAGNPQTDKQPPIDMGYLIIISQIKGSKPWLHIRITQEAFKTHQCPGPTYPRDFD